MYKVFFLLLILQGSQNLNAQISINKPKISHFETINKEVWYPFIEAFERFDLDGFLKVHSPFLVRLNLDQGTNLDYESYYKSLSDEIEFHLTKENRRKIDLRFLHRSISGGVSYEIGYYKVTIFEKNDTKGKDYYGKFNVIIQKENEKWVILMDSDHGITTKDAFDDAKWISDYSSFPSGLIK
jgi:hypothetical protein